MLVSRLTCSRTSAFCVWLTVTRERLALVAHSSLSDAQVLES